MPSNTPVYSCFCCDDVMGSLFINEVLLLRESRALWIALLPSISFTPSVIIFCSTCCLLALLSLILVLALLLSACHQGFETTWRHGDWYRGGDHLSRGLE